MLVSAEEGLSLPDCFPTHPHHSLNSSFMFTDSNCKQQSLICQAGFYCLHILILMFSCLPDYFFLTANLFATADMYSRIVTICFGISLLFQLLS